MTTKRSCQSIITSMRPVRAIGSGLALAAAMACSPAAFAQQKPNWGAPGSNVASSTPAAVHPAWGAGGTVASPATRPAGGPLRAGIGTSAGVVGTTGASGTQSNTAQPGRPAAAPGQYSGPSGTFNAGSSPGVYGAGSRGVTTPAGAQLGNGYNSVTSVPGGGRFAPNQMSSGQLGSANVKGAMSGIGTGSTGGGSANQRQGQGMNLNNGGRSGVADDPATSTGSGTVTGATGSTSTGVGGTGGSPGTANGSDTDAQASAVKTALGKAWAATSSLLGSPDQGSESTDRAVAGVRGEASPVETYGPGSPNATGQKINKGNSGSGDSGSGWGSTGNRSTGGRNAQGQVINAGNAGNNDAPLRKPGQVGVLNTNKLNNGVTDPAAAGIKH